MTRVGEQLHVAVTVGDTQYDKMFPVAQRSAAEDLRVMLWQCLLQFFMPAPRGDGDYRKLELAEEPRSQCQVLGLYKDRNGVPRVCSAQDRKEPPLALLPPVRPRVAQIRTAKAHGAPGCYKNLASEAPANRGRKAGRKAAEKASAHSQNAA